MQNELELLGLISEGNEHAFRKIFNHYSDRLYTYAFRITDNEELAEEIVMDAFMKIWCNRVELSMVNRFDSYLYAIVRNHAFTAIKRRAHESLIINQLSLTKTEYQDCTEDTIVYNEYQHILSNAVNQLPPQQRLVYSLSRDEGLKYDEIADQLNLSKNTVKAHLKKALCTLRIVFSNLMVFAIGILFFLG
ncbi:RNA polymerase sigma-70 factor, ECF subfamily [Daejeonella rubra]|uniref:RNA polymerase sigma-70 factor, ECF subfamily n=1 Tax=Daejeonella rubra TaxID=990371 RepID=A0A1G9TKP7_9SPHI|nr:RNA polymerase sigma-70 factor, ECF subfamily [Daejeonella rubra]